MALARVGESLRNALFLALLLFFVGLLSCALFPNRQLQLNSWLRGGDRGLQSVPRSLRVLRDSNEDHPLVFEEYLRDSIHDFERDPKTELATARQLSGAEDRYTWRIQTKQADFSARYAHAALLNIKEQIYVLGGATADIGSRGESGYLNDVWVSEDHGNTWQWVKPRTPKFSPRRGHAAVVNCNQIVMFVLGGFCGMDCFMNDWWSSEYGDVWEKLGDAPWSARHGHAAVVTSTENLILLGGHDGASYLNDVWSIQDPEQAKSYSTWVQVRSNSPDERDTSIFSPRYGHAVVLNSRDEILVMGGFFADKKAGRVNCFHDVWRSDDEGNSWSLIVEHAPWKGRYQHTAVATADDNVFIIGGLNVDLDRCNDVWRSKDDGATWGEVTPAAPWAARYEHASVIDQNSSLYVIGGMSTGADKFHDVWRSERTCADDVECGSGEVVCRDGTYHAFRGLPNPMCVGICDRRIFDKCSTKEACRVKASDAPDARAEAQCVNPCAEKACNGDGEVCEVYERGSDLKDIVLSDAEAYCLACGDSKTKFACDKLRQCTWSAKKEACLMKCNVADTKAKCKSIGDSCNWKDNKCIDKD
mmetsp:Transcript_73543/g.116024  ORF Transcript_73543/g.116024 Transcript_73543/m.116024 type:complete len:588 (+) Transcript_73543:83-1846(+)